MSEAVGYEHTGGARPPCSLLSYHSSGTSSSPILMVHCERPPSTRSCRVRSIPTDSMSVVLWDGSQWVSLQRNGVGTQAAMPFLRAADASRYLRAMPAQGSISPALRRALCWCDGALAVSRLSHDDVIFLLSERLAAGRLIFTSSSRTPIPRPGLLRDMKGGDIN